MHRTDGLTNGRKTRKVVPHYIHNVNVIIASLHTFSYACDKFTVPQFSPLSTLSVCGSVFTKRNNYS